MATLLAGCSSSTAVVPTETPQNTTEPSCVGAPVVALAVGEVRTALSGTTICLQTDAAAEYTMNAFFGSTVASARTQVGITATGIGATSGAFPSRAPEMEVAFGGGPRPDRSIELGIRAYEKTVLAPRIAGARAAMRRRATTSVAAAVPSVGDILRLNASEEGCQAPRYRFGRVAAVTNGAIIVADTGNPAGGFTDAEYQSIGVTFDTLVNPLVQSAFGAPSDIDQNSRVIVFYTRVVNEMTPRESEGVVQGFFHTRDIFPQTASGGLEGCAGSNAAEMFYMIVPDPEGTINGNKRTKATVERITISVVAHEYQHLINASRRLYFNDADDFEEVWLNEGLSHIAEELLFYRASGLAPRSNLDATRIQATQKSVDAFNAYQIGNFGRYERYLENPEGSSPYADNDSLANRGAIWSMLRYAADRAGPADGTIWHQLVNARAVGLTNLGGVFGPNVIGLIRDWALSVHTDDLVAASSDFQQPSWHFRSIYPRLGRTTFPLRVHQLADGVQTSRTLSAGGSMFAAVKTAAGRTATVSWSVASPAVAVSIVRTR
jgi:hypothetical protein